MLQLFYMDLFKHLRKAREYLRLLEKIKRTEKIKEVTIFRNKYYSDPKRDLFLRIAQEVFKGKLKEEKYLEEIKKSNLIIKIGRFVQRVFSEIKLFLLTEKHNKIFFDDSKIRFELLIRELNKNKKNKLFRCQDHLQKSFFVNKKYIPFYEFTQKKSEHKKKLWGNIKKFRKENKDFLFLDELEMEKSLKLSIKKWLDYYLKFKFLEISGTINHIIKLMKKGKINFIIVFSDSESFDKVFVQVGKLFKIPSIVVLHGLLGNDFSPGFVPLSADYILGYGNGSKKRLHSLGISEKKIILTGSQQFDKYLNKKIITRRKKKIVFIAGYGTKKRARYTLKILFNALKKFPKYKLVVKGRKGWEMNNLPKIIAKQEDFKKVEFIIETDPIKLLFDADMVIINSTTMVLDALLLNKPVISIGFKDIGRFGEHKNSKSIKTVYNQKQLEQAIKECQNQTEENTKERKKYLEKELFKLDGKSSERIADFINELIKKSKEKKTENEKNTDNSTFGY